MASKQLGKLRQWAGEVISSRDKTTVSEEFAELEKDIELRREGAAKLLAASEAYQHVLSKKKKNEAFADVAEKLLPIDSLGIVMVLHGEEFGEDSTLGTSLVTLGRAHCIVATLQEGYAMTFKDTFIASLEKFTDEIKEYDTQRKKLDSRRLSYDAAVAKFDKVKSGKKEKEKKEAEEEMEKAKERYEETSEEVQAQMHAIQDNEVVQMRELSSFLDLEINFVEQYLNVLKDVKADWYSESTSTHIPAPRVNGPAHIFKRSNSANSKRSGDPNTMSSSDSSEEDTRPAVSRKSSPRKRRESSTSKLSSRPPSRSASRKRTDSIKALGDKDEKEKEKEKEKDKDKSKRMSVADWASSAVGSVTGRSKKGKEKFASLNDDEAHQNDLAEEGKNSPVMKFRSLTGKLSREKSLNGSPKLQGKILKPPSLQDRKIATALYSFRGGTDELSFEAGDEILVLNEVLEGWWMGELDGKKGLFPTTHVEISIVRSTPQRKNSGKGASYEDVRKGLTDVDSLHLSSDLEDDHDLARQPLSPNHLASPFYGGLAAASISVESSLGDEIDDERFEPMSRSLPSTTSFKHGDTEDYFFLSTSSDKFSSRSEERQAPPLPTRMAGSAAASVTARKVRPPPLPPRRSTVSNVHTPPVPARPNRAPAPRTITPASSVSSHSHGYDRSPFDSAADLQTARGCGNFRQSSFQAKGTCDNCYQFHT